MKVIEKTVEYCAECPFSVHKRGKMHFCTKAKWKYIKNSEWDDGWLPEWCPLPNEGEQ